MNNWLDFWGGFMIGIILSFCVLGVIRVWEKRGPAKYEDFDIDYNKVAMPQLDPELSEILAKYPKRSFFVPAEMKIDIYPDDMWERNLRAFEYEQRAAIGITKAGRGYGKDHCNDYHPGYYYYCQKNPDHIDATNPLHRRHGYAGVFWD